MDFERTSIKEAEDCHCQCRRSNARCHRFDVTRRPGISRVIYRTQRVGALLWWRYFRGLDSAST